VGVKKRLILMKASQVLWKHDFKNYIGMIDLRVIIFKDARQTKYLPANPKVSYI
jgi:hypothetical protein